MMIPLGSTCGTRPVRAHQPPCGSSVPGILVGRSSPKVPRRPQPPAARRAPAIVGGPCAPREAALSRPAFDDPPRARADTRARLDRHRRKGRSRDRRSWIAANSDPCAAVSYECTRRLVDRRQSRSRPSAPSRSARHPRRGYERQSCRGGMKHVLQRRSRDLEQSSPIRLRQTSLGSLPCRSRPLASWQARSPYMARHTPTKVANRLSSSCTARLSNETRKVTDAGLRIYQAIQPAWGNSP